MGELAKPLGTDLVEAASAKASELIVVDVVEPTKLVDLEHKVISDISMEIVYPYIPDPDGEDEGGQASSFLAVFTRWISVVKLLKSYLATLA
ncbi:hypothetical protein GW17_00038833 [Ensete ventricosum]|nr:hypothetical protein GW17_00038833 [Ensete ventricosum]